jgi:hypothetical protein
MYAVTWLSITRKDGLFLDGFAPCAWRSWTPPEKKTPPANLRASSRKNGGRHEAAQAKSTVSTDAKFTDTELVPVVGVYAETKRTRPPPHVSCITSLRTPAIRHVSTFDRGEHWLN